MCNKGQYWYKNAVIYQLHVKSFFDSNNNGIGDFNGLTLKLDYLQSLGINTLWLLPFYPSPLKDDGYDIADYMDVNPDYGTIADFKRFLKEAHKRNIRVITELVINHTSDQHEWFKRAVRSPKGSKYRNYYMWSDTDEKYKDARIIFKDFETSNWQWHNDARQYYWHRFFSHQPDLNFDNLEVHEEIFKVMDFWFKMGVDGMRLDAVPYLYAREGTSSENLPETHIFLKKLRKYVDKKYPDKMLLAEANQWPEDIIQYFGDGDECHMAFNFPVMPRMFMSLKMQNRFPITDIISQTPKIPDNCQWVIFLRNHDELTLEMVTEEERDYMYRVYADDPKARINLGIRRRLAPLVNGDINQIKILNSLLFSLPGTPVIYYGDEIGMGDNYYLGDRNGVRTPMQWNSDKNAGFSLTDQRNLFLPVINDPEFHYESVNVEKSMKNPDSLLWFIRKLISLRKNFKSLSQGDFKIVDSDNNKILSFLRICNDEILLITVNLSRNVQACELYLSEYNNYTPEEVFGKTLFPPITKAPYNLTMAPLSFYWLSLIKTNDNKNEIIYTSQDTGNLSVLENRLLNNYLTNGISHTLNLTLKGFEIIEKISTDDLKSSLYIFRTYYNEDLPDYRIAIITKNITKDINYLDNLPKETILINVTPTIDKEIYSDGFTDKTIRNELIKNILKNKKIKVAKFARDISFKEYLNRNINSWIIPSSGDNYLVNYDNTFILKIYKKFEFNRRPEVEMIKFLSEKGFKNIPLITDIITYSSEESGVVGIVEQYIYSEGSFDKYTENETNSVFKKVMSLDDKSGMIQHINNNISTSYIKMLEKLGEIIGDMHLLLASDNESPVFKPERFTFMYQRSIYQSLRSEIKKSSEKLDDFQLDEEIESIYSLITSKEDLLHKYISGILNKTFEGYRIRTHGELDLKNILFTGKDFILIDFDGISTKPFSEKKIKRSALREISYLLKSFHYTIYLTVLHEYKLNSLDKDIAYEFAEDLFNLIADTLLQSYYRKISNNSNKESLLFSENIEERNLMLNIFLLNKFYTSLNHEINFNKEQIIIPLMGIKNILKKIEEG